MSAKGWVYIISNPAMPGILKIGFSLKDPELRAQELANTGIPHAYAVEYEILIENPREIEQLAHKRLHKKREGKEWFRCNLEEAIHAIRTVAKTKIILETKKDTKPEPIIHTTTPSQPTVTSSYLSTGTYSGKCSFCKSLITVTIQSSAQNVRCPKCFRQSSTQGFTPKRITI